MGDNDVSVWVCDGCRRATLARDVDTREGDAGGAGVRRKFLSLPVSFAVNLWQLQKIKSENDERLSAT